jgi:hypothetical protein
MLASQHPVDLLDERARLLGGDMACAEVLH